MWMRHANKNKSLSKASASQLQQEEIYGFKIGTLPWTRDASFAQQGAAQTADHFSIHSHPERTAAVQGHATTSSHGLLWNKGQDRGRWWNNAPGDDWNWKSQGVFFKCFPTAIPLPYLQRLSWEKAQVRCVLWSGWGRAPAWKAGLGSGEQGSIMPAPLAAVSLETAIQTQKKTVLDCCASPNL